MVIRKIDSQGHRKKVIGVGNYGDSASGLIKKMTVTNILELRRILNGGKPKDKKRSSKVRISSKKPVLTNTVQKAKDARKLVFDAIKSGRKFKSASDLIRYLKENKISENIARQIIHDLLKSKKLDPQKVFTDKASISNLRKNYSL